MKATLQEMGLYNFLMYLKGAQTNVVRPVSVPVTSLKLFIF